MIDLPTPETDAVAEKNIYGVACKVDVDFARKLERQRDELQDALEHAQMTIGSIVSPSDKATLELIKVTKERDEAREIAQQLINIASHCLGWHENANPETITEAIKRWNAATKK